MTRSGFIAVAGRPNVGKSTLVNGMVGRKVAIVSDKPQTTRRAIRGVATLHDTQLVLVDLPGVQRPRDALTERMQHRVESEMAESDAALFVVNAEQGIGPGDRELGDVVICPEHTEDLAEAVVHGVLHLVGMDHESDEGEMLAIQAEVVSWLG